MTDWPTVPVFGNPDSQYPTVVRPSAYAVIADAYGNLAVVRTPGGTYLLGGGQTEAEAPEATVVREAREECGLCVRVGPWRRAAIEHVSSPMERTHFEKRSTFCDAVVAPSPGGAVDGDHALMWVAPEEAVEVLRPASHRWVIAEWLRDADRLSFD